MTGRVVVNPPIPQVIRAGTTWMVREGAFVHVARLYRCWRCEVARAFFLVRPSGVWGCSHCMRGEGDPIDA